MLAGKHPVGARDGLHQRVIAHGLVEIDGRAAGCVEAGEPHGTDEYQPQRVCGVLELLVQTRLGLIHAPTVRLDVEAERRHLRDLVLTGRDDYRHVGGCQRFNPAHEF